MATDPGTTDALPHERDDQLRCIVEQAKLHNGPADGPLQDAAGGAQELLDARAELTRLRALTAVPEDLRAVAIRAACDDYNGAMPACEWPACGCTSDGTARYNPTVSIADAILAAIVPAVRAQERERAAVAVKPFSILLATAIRQGGEHGE